MTTTTETQAIATDAAKPKVTARQLVLNVAWRPELSDGSIGPDVTQEFPAEDYADTFAQYGGAVDLYLALEISSNYDPFETPNFARVRLTPRSIARLNRFRWVLLADMDIKTMEVEDAPCKVYADGFDPGIWRLVITRDEFHFACQDKDNREMRVESSRFDVGTLFSFLDGKRAYIEPDDASEASYRWVGGSVVCAHGDMKELVASLTAQVPEVAAKEHAKHMAAQIALGLDSQAPHPSVRRRSVGV